MTDKTTAFSDWDVKDLVQEEAPRFERLEPALKERGFKIAAYDINHANHKKNNEIYSDCRECIAETMGKQ